MRACYEISRLNDPAGNLPAATPRNLCLRVEVLEILHLSAVLVVLLDAAVAGKKLVHLPRGSFKNALALDHSKLCLIANHATRYLEVWRKRHQADIDVIGSRNYLPFQGVLDLKQFFDQGFVYS
jgi:hypothetical protein